MKHTLFAVLALLSLSAQAQTMGDFTTFEGDSYYIPSPYGNLGPFAEIKMTPSNNSGGGILVNVDSFETSGATTEYLTSQEVTRMVWESTHAVLVNAERDRPTSITVPGYPAETHDGNPMTPGDNYTGARMRVEPFLLTVEVENADNSENVTQYNVPGFTVSTGVNQNHNFVRDYAEKLGPALSQAGATNILGEFPAPLPPNPSEGITIQLGENEDDQQITVYGDENESVYDELFGGGWSCAQQLATYVCYPHDSVSN